LRDFRRYLIQKKIDRTLEKRIRKNKSQFNYDDNTDSERPRIRWIEIQLQTPYSDYRKYCIWRILVPYLINVKKLPNEEASSIIEDWLDICDQAERLDFDPQTKINDAIKRVGDFRPIGLDRPALNLENRELYDLISTRL
jgi:Primase X